MRFNDYHIGLEDKHRVQELKAYNRGICRHSFSNYKTNFACFNCQKSFKRPKHYGIRVGEGNNKKYIPYNRMVLRNPDYEFAARCPDCRAAMYDFGRDWKPPTKTNNREWRIMRELASAEIDFHSCGCGGRPGIRVLESPRKAALLAQAVKDYPKQNGGRTIAV